ncbi:helix-turn-helix domain-containing protein [Fulvivirga lutea]|uniref:Helix-turn-helix transcriptional regulator n=1 Tax=Fulvivirga lutea TaxID=2810512 RepID=A0A974WI99_9BACT|nr:helix-turn-helix transcriptional regulator [Fulvivirga lutea]
MELDQLLIDTQINIGEKIKSLRKSKGISTIEMSRRCLMDSGNYVRIEQGKLNLTLKTLLKVCLALNIELKDLIK